MSLLYPTSSIQKHFWDYSHIQSRIVIYQYSFWQNYYMQIFLVVKLDLILLACLQPNISVNFLKLLFTNSICPSAYGWFDELNFKSIFNLFHNVHKKYQTNLVSRSETILFGRPCSITTSLKQLCYMNNITSLLERNKMCHF